MTTRSTVPLAVAALVLGGWATDGQAQFRLRLPLRTPTPRVSVTPRVVNTPVHLPDGRVVIYPRTVYSPSDTTSSDENADKPDEGFPWWGWALIGVGGVVALIFLGAALGKEPDPPPAVSQPAIPVPETTPVPETQTVPCGLCTGSGKVWVPLGDGGGQVRRNCLRCSGCGWVDAAWEYA